MIEHVSEQDLLLAFAGELPPDRSDSVHAHTRGCTACKEKWMSLSELSLQVASLQCPDVDFLPQETAVGALLSRMDNANARKQNRPHWTSRSLAVANTLAAVAVAITCIVLLPSLHRAP